MILTSSALLSKADNGMACTDNPFVEVVAIVFVYRGFEAAGFTTVMDQRVLHAVALHEEDGRNPHYTSQLIHSENV